MNTAWFILLGVLLTGYAILDGIDLGIGALHLVAGRNDRERRANLGAIGPFWSGYEVWLVVAGGAMVAAFPRLYAASFSGFYLVLTVVLWLLIARGVAIEFRGHVADPLWRTFWDVVFNVSSLLLAVFFGAAFGNVVRGVPMDANGYFIGSFALTLNPYALLVGLLSVVVLSMHGANFLAMRTEGDHREHARRWARRLWYIAAVLTIATTAAGFVARTGLAVNFVRHPAVMLLPILAVAALAAMYIFQTRAKDGQAVLAGGVFIGALMASAGASLYPFLLPALGQPGQGLTIYNSAAPHHNLVVAFAANIIALSGVIAYHIYIHRVFSGTVDTGDDGHGY